MMAWLLLCFALLAQSAHAATPVEEAQQAELDRVRAEVADQIHLTAFDLVDEMVYGWTVEPPFETPTPVVVAGVTVPVGLGTALQAQVENHLANVLSENPATQVQLAHCPQCTAVIVHSGPEGTIVSRGFDNPAVLEELGATTGKHALFLDIEAEGTFLVLRARLTRLTPELPIVWSHTLATSASTPALLRESDNLKSASDARAEYLAALEGTGQIRIPLRFAVRAYAKPPDFDFGGGGTPPPPFLWVQTGVDIAPTNARDWTSTLLVGGSFIPQAYKGLMAEARVNRLITGRSRSLTRPDLYLFAGGTIQSVWGLATASFQTTPLTTDAILLGLTGQEPRHTMGTLLMGADVRMGNRMSIGAYLETLPALRNSDNIGEHIRLVGIDFQSFGTEVTFWF